MDVLCARLPHQATSFCTCPCKRIPLSLRQFCPTRVSRTCRDGDYVLPTQSHAPQQQLLQSPQLEPATQSCTGSRASLFALGAAEAACKVACEEGWAAQHVSNSHAPNINNNNKTRNTAWQHKLALTGRRFQCGSCAARSHSPSAHSCARFIGTAAASNSGVARSSSIFARGSNFYGNSSNEARHSVAKQPLSSAAHSLIREVVQEMSQGCSVVACGFPPSPTRSWMCLNAAIERVLVQPPPADLVASLPLYTTGHGAPPRVLAILVCPTHQLAAQAHELAHELLLEGDHQANVQLMHGGAPIEDDLLALRTSCPALLVVTPGRLMHLVSQGAQVRLEHLLGGVRLVVLDGAEELLALPAIRFQVDEALRGLAAMAGGRRSRVPPRTPTSQSTSRQLLATAAAANLAVLRGRGSQIDGVGSSGMDLAGLEAQPLPRSDQIWLHLADAVRTFTGVSVAPSVVPAVASLGQPGGVQPERGSSQAAQVAPSLSPQHDSSSASSSQQHVQPVATPSSQQYIEPTSPSTQHRGIAPPSSQQYAHSTIFQSSPYIDLTSSAPQQAQPAPASSQQHAPSALQHLTSASSGTCSLGASSRLHVQPPNTQIAQPPILLPVRYATAPMDELPSHMLAMLLAHAQQTGPRSRALVLCPTAAAAAAWAAAARGMGLPALELHGRRSAEYRSEALDVFRLKTPASALRRHASSTQAAGSLSSRELPAPQAATRRDFGACGAERQKNSDGSSGLGADHNSDWCDGGVDEGSYSSEAQPGGGGKASRGGLVLFSAGGLTKGVELPGLSMVLQVGLPRSPQRVEEVMYHMHSRLQQAAQQQALASSVNISGSVQVKPQTPASGMSSDECVQSKGQKCITAGSMMSHVNRSLGPDHLQVGSSRTRHAESCSPPPPVLNVMLVADMESQGLGNVLKQHKVHMQQQHAQQQQQQEGCRQQLQQQPQQQLHTRHQEQPQRESQQRQQQPLPAQQQPLILSPDRKSEVVAEELISLLACHHTWAPAPSINSTFLAQVHQAQRSAVQKLPRRVRNAAFVSLLAYYRQHPLAPFTPGSWRHLGLQCCQVLELRLPPSLPLDLATEWGPEWLGSTFRAAPAPRQSPSPTQVAAALERRRLHQHWILMKAAKKQRKLKKTAAAAAAAAAVLKMDRS